MDILDREFTALANACLDYLNYDRLGLAEVHKHLTYGDRALHCSQCGAHSRHSDRESHKRAKRDLDGHRHNHCATRGQRFGFTAGCRCDSESG